MFFKKKNSLPISQLILANEFKKRKNRIYISFFDHNQYDEFVKKVLLDQRWKCGMTKNEIVH